VKKNLVIIDYGLGNLRSVSNALKFLGAEAVISDDPALLNDAAGVILPGVGAFEDGMFGLRQKNLIRPLLDFAHSGRPFLGICLGMQLLMTKSFEFGEHDGLDLVHGEVVPFKNKLTDGQYNYKIPHMGWNSLHQAGLAWPGTILEGLKDGAEVYFVHSFFAVTKNPQHVLATTSYAGETFCSVSTNGKNVFGCQFHPEKSSNVGLKILENFIRMMK
jgi:imidazole glycerol-phosphate synthase subunit HisH